MSQFRTLPAAASSDNSSIGINGNTAPASSTEVGGINPSGNLQPLKTDASGNLLISPAATGVAGHVIVDSSALPTGAATQTTLATVSTTLGSILLDMTNGTQVTGITGTVPLPTGASTAALQTSGNSQLVTIASNQTNGTQVTAVNSSVLPTGAATETTLAAINTKTPVLGQALAAASVPVVLTAAQLITLTPPTTVAVTQAALAASTATLTNVSGSATTVSLLASNAGRKGAMVTNDSTASLYVKFGTTASTTSYTVLIPPGAYYEFPANTAIYTGAVDGIWSAANGAARITELS